jgi:hypothetical protein
MMKASWKLVVCGVVVALVLPVVAPAKAAEKAAKGKGKAESVTLPAAAADAIKKDFPQATVDKVKTRSMRTLQVFLAVLKSDKGGIEVVVSAEGVIAEVKTPVAQADLPKVVSDAITNALQGATIASLDKEEIRAVVGKDAVLKKLDTPRCLFIAHLTKDGKRSGVVRVKEDGTVLGGKAKTGKAGKDKTSP